MPNLPDWIGDVAEVLIQQRAKVVETQYLDQHLKMVRFESNVVRKRSYKPGQWVEFRAGGSNFRHYTPSSHDVATGTLEVLFYLHDNGPGSKWGDGLKAGDDMIMLGPAGNFVLDEKATNHLFIGDETSIGTCKAMQSRVKNAATYNSLIECEEINKCWPELTGLKATIAIRQNLRGEALRQLVRNADIPKDTAAYVSGHAATIQLIRKELLAKGLNSKQILAKAYWADNKTGL